MPLPDVIHSTLTGPDAIHPAAFVASVDPGAVGANKFWVDTSGATPVLKLRDVTNATWAVVGGGGGGGGGSFGPDTPIQMTVQNESGGPLPKGASVTITSGASGAHPAVIDFRDSDPGGRDHILGVLAEAIADTATGLCTVRGPLAGIDTSGFSLGNVIYAGSPAGPTGWVAGFPATPYSRQLGIITVVDATVGEIYVLPEEASVFDHGHTGPGDGGALGPFVVAEQIPSGNPSAGTQFLFISTVDHKLYRRTSAGVDTLIG